MSTFKNWYDSGGAEKLSKARRQKYANDPVYRQKVLDRAAKDRKNKIVTPAPEGFTITMNEAADKLGCSVWVLREWRRKNYFPEPLQHKGKILFNEHQMLQLWELHGFFLINGIRVKEEHKEKLDNLVSLIYSNWTTT